MIAKLRQLIIALLLLVGIGCGGGTRGSGGQLYEGFIGDESLKALPGLSVTIVQSGDSATSDEEGRFTIQTTSLAGKLSLLVEGSNISTTIETAEVPADATRIKLTITIPSSGSSGASATIEVTERRPPKKPSTPTGSGGGSNRPNDDSPSDEGEEDDSNDDNEDSDDDADDGAEDNSDDDDGDSDSNDDPNGGSSGGGSSDDGSGDSDGDDDDSGSSGGSGDGSGGDSPQDGDKRDVTGTISSISGSSITVTGLEFHVTDDSEFRDLEGKESSLGNFNVGVSVRARGVYQSGKILLERLEAR